MDKNPHKIILQIRSTGGWEDAAEVRLKGTESEGANAATIFEYEVDYALNHKEARGYSAVSCLFPVNFAPTECDTWPSFLLDLFPQGAALKYIVDHHRIADRSENYWKILKKACLNPPGNVRVLHPNHLEEVPKNHPGFNRNDVLKKGPKFLDYMIENGAPVAGTTGAGGAAPKFLLREDRNNFFHADGGLDDSDTKECWLVKYPRGRDSLDRLILENESRYLRVAKKIGLRVESLSVWENDCLFVPRFDREIVSGGMHYWGLESFYSLVGSTGFGSRFRHETYLDAIKRFCSQPKVDAIEYVFRDFLNFMMGNTDNHGRNISVLKKKDVIGLSPIYDFAPMKFDPESIPRNTRWSFNSDIDILGISKILEEKGLLDTNTFKASLRDFYQNTRNLKTLLEDENVDEQFISKTSDEREFLLDNIAKFLR